MIRETLRDDSEKRMGDTKEWILMTDRNGAGTCECYLTESASVSRSSSVVECWLWSLLIRRSKFKNFSTNGNLFEEWKSYRELSFFPW